MPKFRYTLDDGISWVYLDVTLPHTITALPTQKVIVEPLGPLLTLEDLSGLRVAEISTMTGGRTAVVPQAYANRVTIDAFNPALHPIGDPLSPSCTIYTHKAVKDGNWSDATVWDVGSVPNANSIVCTSGYDITYDVFSNILIKDIHVSGTSTWKWSRTVQTRLWVDTFQCDGDFDVSTFQNPMPDSGILVGGKRQPMAEIIHWQSEAPLNTARLGTIITGAIRWHGARKTNTIEATGTIAAGATSVTLEKNAAQAGWKVGDEILIVGTEWSGTSSTDAQYSGPTSFWGPVQDANGTRTQNSGFKNNQSETRTITEVDGTVVRWTDPLQFNHVITIDTLPRGQVVTLRPIVSMLTQSFRIRSADASDTAWVGDLSDLQKRAHFMAAFSDDVQIRNIEFKNMGRTDTNPSLNGPDGTTRYATSGTTTPITNVNNVTGRYPIHLHRNGPYFGRKQVVVEACSVWAPTNERPIPGWGITQHDSRAAIEHCVVHNVRGAGIVSELGSETGQWIGNVVAWARGDGFEVDWGSRAEKWQNHNGHSGVGYENQARQILQQDNYASGCRMSWLFMQQNVGMLNRIPDADSLRLRDPITQGGRANGQFAGEDYENDNLTYGIEQAQVPDFFRNHSWDHSSAFWKAHQQHTDRTDPTPFIIKECHWINGAVQYNLKNYTFHYYVYDSLWIGHSTSGTVGAFMGPVMWADPFVNVKLKRIGNGFVDGGLSIAYQTYWLDVAFENVTTPFVGSENLDYGADPTTRGAWGIMGDAQVTGATTGRARLWSAMTTASLPSPYPLAPYGPDSATRTANPCPAFGQDPYVVLDPSSDITLTPTGTGQFSIKALIVDSLGYRWHGDHQSPETTLTIMTPKQLRPGTNPSFATGTDIVNRNGCFNDGGVWKSRCPFPDVDRATGNHFVWTIDFILSGFDAGYLAAKTVDPVVASAIDWPVKPEMLSVAPIAAPVAPVITTGTSFSNTENTVLSVPLLCNTGLARWSVTGGADAADFEVVFLSNQWVLRWAANGTKDFETPDDTGVNNVYDVQVTCTSFQGVATSQTISISVLNMLESVTSFSDDFAGPAGEFLDVRTGYLLHSGSANRLQVVAYNGQLRNQMGTGTTAYLLPDIGRTDNFIVRARFPSGGGPSIRFAPAATPLAGQRFLFRRDNNTSQLFVIYVNLAGTVLTWQYPNPNSNRVTVEVVSGAFRVLYNGVEQTPTVNPAARVLETIPAGHRFFLTTDLNEVRDNILDDLYIGPAV